jgi:hypothetical protein
MAVTRPIALKACASINPDCLMFLLLSLSLLPTLLFLLQQIDKYLVVKYFAKPPQYDTQLAHWVSNVNQTVLLSDCDRAYPTLTLQMKCSGAVLYLYWQLCK